MKRSRETLEESVGETSSSSKRIHHQDDIISSSSSSAIYINRSTDKESNNNAQQHSSTVDERRKKDSDSDDETSSNHCIPNRPRTEQYIENLQKYQKIQETIQFFQKSLQSLSDDDGDESTTSSSQQQQQQQLIQQNLSKQLSIQQTKYQSSLQQCVDNAQERLDVYNSLQCMRTAAAISTTTSNSNSKSTSSCPLVMLHQGMETTDALFDRIAQFAGIPSNDEIMDCEQLITIACSSAS